MNTIDQLIKQHCPDGVPFKQLGNVTTNFDRKRRPITKSKRISGPYPYFGANGVQDFVEDYIFDGIYVLIGEDGSVRRDDGTPYINWLEGKAWVNNHAHVLKGNENQLLDRFLFHVLCTINISPFISSGTQPKLTKSRLSALKIPVPPLEVQQKIVEILDTFTKLEAELEAELEARQEQFLFYSEKLFELDDSYPVRSFGDLATIVRGSSPRPIRNYLVKTGNPWIKIGDAPSSGRFIRSTAQFVSDAGAEKSRLIEPGDFLLSNSMSFGRPYISKISGYIHDGWLSISSFENYLDANYLYYFLRTQRVQKEFSQKAGSGTVKNLNAQIVKSLSVPVPPLNVQQRIATALANFDDLVSDLNSGLPAELAARRQQYEYYRDQLLTFKELDA